MSFTFWQFASSKEKSLSSRFSHTERKISFIINKFAFGQSLSADVADVDVVYILD